MNETLTSQSSASQSHSGAQPLIRPTEDRMVAGVAAGIARYLGADVTIVGIVFAVLAFVGGVGVPLRTDLPGAGPPPRRVPGRPRGQRPGWGRIIGLAVLVIIAVSIAQALVHVYFFWILLALVVFLLLRHGPLRR